MVGLILFSVLLVSGCTTFSINRTTNTTTQFSSCEAWARLLIPDNMTLTRTIDGSFPDKWSVILYSPVPNNFNDETNMSASSASSMFWEPGSQVSENINLYYMREYSVGLCTRPGADCSIKYLKQTIKPDGTISGTNTFSFIPILQPIPGTLGNYSDLRGMEKMAAETFRIVDASISGCNLVD